MKLTANKTNVVAPASPYPYGDIKDNTGPNDGTPVNREFLTDYIQFFEKIFDMSGLTANGLPDNETDGFQLVEALFNIMPKKYVKEVDLVGDGETVNITKAEIDASFGVFGGFHKGFLGTGTTQNQKTDLQIQVQVRDTTTSVWKTLTNQGSGGELNIEISETTGDITLNINIAPNTYLGRVVIIG